MVHGRVKRKDRLRETPHYENTPQEFPVIDRKRPGKGYRHVLSIDDVQRFLSIVPAWRKVSNGLNAIVLAQGEPDCIGWHRPGVIGLCAWPRDLQDTWDMDLVDDHLSLLQRLDVRLQPTSERRCLLQFHERSARGFALMHVFLHELGHHQDRMTTRTRVETARGEDFAECFAHRVAEAMWEDYFRMFGW